MFKIFIILSLTLIYQEKAIAQIQTISFENLETLQTAQPRPVVILIMTSWCKYCHAMKNSMLNNNQVSRILSDKFYVVFLNAEYKGDILFSGRRFKFKPSGPNTGIHELAEALGTVNGQVTYPLLCFLNDKNEIIYQKEGFLNTDGLVFLLKNIQEDKQ